MIHKKKFFFVGLLLSLLGIKFKLHHKKYKQMKKLLIVLAIGTFAACNSSTDSSTTDSTSTTSTDTTMMAPDTSSMMSSGDTSTMMMSDSTHKDSMK